MIRGGVWLVRSHAGWMGFNLALALVPLVLAVVLFRSRRRRGPLWWVGVAVFVVFLPNAPYVMTDVIHLHGEVRNAPSTRAVVLGVLPLYGVFVLVGLVSYALSLRLVRGYFSRVSGRGRAIAIEGLLQVACAFGVVLGRLGRLNSWDVLRPSRLGSGVVDALHHPLLLVFTVMAITIASLVVDRAGSAVFHLASRVVRPASDPVLDSTA